MIKAAITNRRGTALLVALLVMGVLVAVSLALSSLIFRETRVVKDLIDSGRAYYAAEAGIEKALYGLNTNLPGWEPDDDDGNGYTSFKVDREKDSVAEYKVSNRCKAFPCFDEGYDVASVSDPSEFYGVLDLNESITIPLFVVNGDGGDVTDVKHFAVEFFAKFNPQEHLNLNAETSRFLRGWDVLRWKVFGVNDRVNVTETISDFTALSMANRGDESFLTNASNPSWFGTRSCDGAGQRYTDGIECGQYPRWDYSTKEIDGEGIGQISDIFTGNCLHTEAREYYFYEYESADKRNLEAENIHKCYSIEQFVKDHTLNYLSLTNLINPAVFNGEVDSDKREAFSKLYFRVELFPSADGAVDNQTVREFADITSNGYSGKSKQSINVKIKKGSFMPVFHFSLYSTYKDLDVDGVVHDDEYWYGEEESE